MSREWHYGDADRPLWGGEAAHEARDHAEAQRLQRAALAREIANEHRLSGSHDQAANTRSFLTTEFRSSVRRDPSGRLVIDWARVDENTGDDT